MDACCDDLFCSGWILLKYTSARFTSPGFRQWCLEEDTSGPASGLGLVLVLDQHMFVVSLSSVAGNLLHVKYLTLQLTCLPLVMSL
jgi:hypothetical protein